MPIRVLNKCLKVSSITTWFDIYNDISVKHNMAGYYVYMPYRDRDIKWIDQIFRIPFVKRKLFSDAFRVYISINGIRPPYFRFICPDPRIIPAMSSNAICLSSIDRCMKSRNYKKRQIRYLAREYTNTALLYCNLLAVPIYNYEGGDLDELYRRLYLAIYGKELIMEKFPEYSDIHRTIIGVIQRPVDRIPENLQHIYFYVLGDTTMKIVFLPKDEKINKIIALMENINKAEILSEITQRIPKLRISFDNADTTLSGRMLHFKFIDKYFAAIYGFYSMKYDINIYQKEHADIVIELFIYYFNRYLYRHLQMAAQ
jgi:hypothetical protein